MKESKWKIIKGLSKDGSKTQYQVSNGDVGKSSFSYDFFNLKEAKKCLKELITNEPVVYNKSNTHYRDGDNT